MWTRRRCDVNDISVACLRSGGDKPPLVMLHGLMGSGACWTPIARMLEAEFDVILPDARGHGGSSAPESGYLSPELASDVLGLMQALELTRPVLLGHSMGGMTAALVASWAPGLLSKLVLVDPTFLSPAYQQEVFESGVAEQHREALKCTKEELVAKALARSGGRSRELIEIQAEARLNTSFAAFEALSPPTRTIKS
ncbi:MAG: alpha/beta hydrolase [Polyangiaceae bacterium]